MPRKPSGFTLIEVLVAISILSITAMVAIPNYHRFNESQKLSNAAAALASELKSAETNAQTKIGCYHGVNVEEVPSDWKVAFSTSTTDLASNNYSISCDYLDSTGTVQPGNASPSYPASSPIGMLTSVTFTDSLGGTCSTDPSPTVAFTGSGVNFTSSCSGTLVKMTLKLTDSTIGLSSCLDVEEGGVISLVACS